MSVALKSAVVEYSDELVLESWDLNTVRDLCDKSRGNFGVIQQTTKEGVILEGVGNEDIPKVLGTMSFNKVDGTADRANTIEENVKCLLRVAHSTKDIDDLIIELGARASVEGNLEGNERRPLKKADELRVIVVGSVGRWVVIASGV